MIAAFAVAVALSGIVEGRLAESETPACVAVARVAEKTEIAFGCTPGIARPPNLDEHSIFEIDSISKGLTGLLLADMVHRGEVSLDDPVSRYARRGAKLPLRGGKEITLRDLVTHTSGLPRSLPGLGSANPLGPVTLDPWPDFTEDTLYEALAATETRGPLGRYEYSNFGFLWLTDLLARRLGKPYDIALKERILDPLGMTETVVVLDASQQARFVPGHRGDYVPAPPLSLPVNVSGAGGVRSSLSDMSRLAGALAGRIETPIREAIALALEPMRSNVGFAWNTSERGDTRVKWHSGGTNGFSSMIVADPATHVGAVVLGDSRVGFDDLARHLVDPDMPLRNKRIALTTDVATLKQYEGRYEMSPARAIEVFVDGTRLMAQATGQYAIEILRDGPDAFFPYVVPARLRFSRGANGEVDGLALEQGGRETKGKRSASVQ